jgi:ferredoxin
MTITAKTSQFLPHQRFQELLDVLQQSGYTCIGPQIHEHTIHYDELTDVSFLPVGMTDVQQPGSYRLNQSDHQRYFAWANGAQGLKPLVFKPREALWQAQQSNDKDIEYKECVPESQPLAIIGVRPCDIAALYIQDKHFLQQDYRDPYYLSYRQDMLLVVVNCTHPAQTCFCASTGDGPSINYGYDILLTELDEGFVVHAHTEKGCQIIAKHNLDSVTDSQIEQANSAIKDAAEQQTRQLPAVNIQKKLADNLEHPHWEEIANRCLSCGNCTSVCPTCFCHSEIEEPALDGSHSTHYRQWDSCFSQKHSYIHGVTIRNDTSLRYRQWLTHKLSSWHEQFGRSGCVGCGRCITWCPVGIDLTEETRILCAGEVND